MFVAEPDRRKTARAKGTFIVSYRVLEEEDNLDVSQSKNIGLGGMLLTTNRQFKLGAKLALDIRLPIDPDPIMLIGSVVDSKEVIKNLIYDTRLAFLAVDEKHQKAIRGTVEHVMKHKR